MAMSCGYGAASLTERIYGWPAYAATRRRSRAADLHDRLGQRGHPRRPGRAVGARPAAGAGDLGVAARGALLLRPGVRDANPQRPGRLPARRGVPLLLLRLGDIVREGKPFPRPPLPADAAQRRRHIRYRGSSGAPMSYDPFGAAGGVPHRQRGRRAGGAARSRRAHRARAGLGELRRAAAARSRTVERGRDRSHDSRSCRLRCCAPSPGRNQFTANWCRCGPCPATKRPSGT